LGTVLFTQGNLDDARALYASLLEGGLRHLGTEHATTLTVKSNLADLLQRQGEYAQAEQLRREVSEVHRRRLGRTADATMLNEHSLANVLLLQGKLAEAESLYLDLLERSETAFGAGDWRRGLFVMGIGACHGGQGCYESSAMMLLDAFTGFDAQLGLENNATQRCLSLLVRAYEQCNEWEKAAAFRCKLLQAE
jgi:tetratricopeptide (TPR) repeat protein